MMCYILYNINIPVLQLFLLLRTRNLPDNFGSICLLNPIGCHSKSTQNS